MESVIASNAHLAKLLLSTGLYPRHIVDQLAETAQAHGSWLGQTLIEAGILTDRELAEMLAKEINLPLIELYKLKPDQHVLARATEAFCLTHMAVPVTATGNSVRFAVANPFDTALCDQMNPGDACELLFSVASLGQITRAIQSWYHDESLPSPTTAPEMQPFDVSPMTSPPTTVRDAGDTRPAEKPQSSTNDPAMVIQRGVTGNLNHPDVGPAYPQTLVDLLTALIQAKGSDLHLTAGSPPLLRVNGSLRQMSLPRLQPHSVRELVFSLLTPELIAQFEFQLELDFSFGLGGLARFRMNVFQQRSSVGAIFRYIPKEVPSLDALGMPPVLRDFCALQQGLILVTGPTGCGKTTTLASMLEEMNNTRHAHIVTLEDPIEFVFVHRKCEINQRQIGVDSKSYTTALKYILRQDPDIILISEMRDLETIAAAMTAAETGHLVLGTLHTGSAIQTIDRIIDVFPPNQQSQIRAQLSSILEGVISQSLIPRISGGRACVQEILVGTPAVRTMIREKKTHQLQSIIESGSQFGMQTLDKALMGLVRQNIISLEEARRRCVDKDSFSRANV